MSRIEYCPKCGAIAEPWYGVSLRHYKCSKCGYQFVKNISNLWYLPPILLGLIGGLIAYIANRELESDKAMGFLIIGIIVSILLFLLNLYGFFRFI